jgi:glycolate oxidase iron-sulfur subunit
VKQAVLDDIEKCVKCGSCKAFCPTYALALVEPMSARGRLVLLRGLVRGELAPSPLLSDRIMSCLLCGMCETSCPVGVGITEAIYQGRGELGPTDRERRLIRGITRVALKRPGFSYRAARAFRPLLPYLKRKGTLPFDISLPDEPLRKGLRIYKPEKAVGRVAVFTGCSVNFIFPHLGESLIHILAGMGFEVVLPAGEVCCGAPLRAMGLEQEAARLAERNLEVFGMLKAEAVLSLCPTCTLAARVQYPALIGQGIGLAMDATEFLAARLEALMGETASGSGIPEYLKGPALYHDPCHLRDGLGVREEPRALIEAMGLELMETGPESCCGMSLAFTHRDISDWLLEDRAEKYREASTVLTACPGCVLQLSRAHKNVVHIVQALDDIIHPAGD